MKTPTKILTALLAAALASASASAADDRGPARSAEGLIASPEPGWPQWRGVRRDGMSTESGLLEQWPDAGPPLRWKLDTLGTGWSSPIVVEGRLFITGDVDDDLVIYAFDTDGKPLWQTVNGRSWKGSFPGARATCAFSDGRLYHLNAHGRLACLDPESGRTLFSTNVLDRFDAENIHWALSECLLVDGDRVIVTPGGRKALMAALDKRTGRTVWTTPPLGDDVATHSSPLLFRFGGRRLIAQCSSAHGFGADADTGELLWTVPLKNQHKVNTSTPQYGGGCVFYVTPYAENGRLYRLRPTDGGVDAEHVWTNDLDTVTGCAVLLDDTLYAAGYRRDKHWFGFDWATGETRCESEDFTTGAAIFADRRLYVFDESGAAGLLDPGDGRLDTVGRMRLVERRVRDAWAHPVLLDGRLYLRYHGTLWCFDVKRAKGESP